MKSALVIPSIHRLDNLRSFDLSHITQVIVVDDGDEKLREYNDKVLDELPHSFFGPEEIKQSLRYEAGVIPIRCHAQISFGFYQAYQSGVEVVFELDDDCWRGEFGRDLVIEHTHNLGPTRSNYIEHVNGNWYNPLWRMGSNLFPRGYPYDPKTRKIGAIMHTSYNSTILNMGLWNGQPDLDAATILSMGGLNGRAGEVEELSDQKFIAGKDIFFPICSMNTSFRAEIIPAFYQMYMNYEGLDRYCDIWSGLFIKKIADHLGKNISFGQPVVEHRKTERSTFKDLRAEHEGMAINETLWKVVRDMQLEGKNYIDAYGSLISGLQKAILANQFPDYLHNKMMRKQLNSMIDWLELFE